MVEESMAVANGVHNEIVRPDKAEDHELTQMVMELSFENDYSKVQIVGIQNENIRSAEESMGEDSKGEVKLLHENIDCLNKEIEQSRKKLRRPRKMLWSIFGFRTLRQRKKGGKEKQWRRKMGKKMKEKGI